MKALRIILLAVCTIAVALFSACNKDKDNDYRNKWIGTYDCEEEYFHWSMSDEMYTKIYQTSVDVIKKGDSILEFIERRGEHSFETKISNDGIFYKEDGNSSCPFSYGHFNNDSLFMTINFSGCAHGFVSQSSFKGKKLK